jgi:secreted trypsin-like serine protease
MSFFCTSKGDSGSPLVQYVNGRAVVIGINSGSWIDDTEKWPSDNGCGHEHSESIFARISRFIDWIEEIIRKGDEWAAKDYPHEK